MCRKDLYILRKTVRKTEDTFKRKGERGRERGRERSLSEKDRFTDSINCITIDDGQEAFGEEFGKKTFLVKYYIQDLFASLGLTLFICL